MRGLRRILREGRFTAYLMRDRRWLAILVCLLIAFFFWTLAAISDSEGYTKEIPVRLDKPILPTGYRMTDLTKYPEEVRVQVHARGESLLNYTFRHIGHASYRVRPAVDTTLLRSEGGDYLFTAGEIKALLLSKTLPDVARMGLAPGRVTVSPEEIAFSYEPLAEGKAEVIFASQIDYGTNRNFKLADTLSILPPTVRIFGVKSDIEAFTAAGGVLLTDTIGIRIDHPGRDTVRLAVVRPQGIDVVPDSVDVVLKTNELLYRSFTTSDIEIRNLPRGYHLRLLPGTVTVTYLLPRDRAGEKTLFDIGLYIDAREAFNPSRRTLTLHAERLPRQVEMVQLVPDRLDYILSEL